MVCVAAPTLLITVSIVAGSGEREAGHVVNETPRTGVPNFGAECQSDIGGFRLHGGCLQAGEATARVVGGGSPRCMFAPFSSRDSEVVRMAGRSVRALGRIREQ